MMRARNYYRTKFRQTRDQADWEHYKCLKKGVINQIRKAKIKRFNTIGKEMKNNPGKAWSQLKQPLDAINKRRITILKTDNGVLTSKSDIAQAFNEQFTLALNTLPSAQHHQLNTCSNRLQFTSIEAEEVCKLLTTFNVKKAAGPDG